MAVRRPKGQLHDTTAGSDEVAGAPPASRAARAAAPQGGGAGATGVDPGHLDDREQRQKPTRKPAGPSGQRLTDADVLVDGKRAATPTTSTEPG